MVCEKCKEKTSDSAIEAVYHSSITGLHTCFVCGEIDQNTLRCNASPLCGKFYHLACVNKFSQTRLEKNRLYCPLHTCATCFVNADDDEDDLRREATKGRLLRCVRCPTAYHTNDLCIAAGCIMLGGNHILCSRHFKPDLKAKGKYHNRVNVGWCFQCSNGGTLVCCDNCPAAYHAECLDISPPEPEGLWYCKDCVVGRRLHYGDIVWVKIGVYRWWPCEICLPHNVPDNILALPHDVGEFPVRFFGTNEYYWTFQGRAFPFQEGDKGRKAASSKTLAEGFCKAMEEAQSAYAVWSTIQTKREEELIEKCNKKPAPYKHVKCNVPLGRVEIPRVIISELPCCQCRHTDDQPCGPDSDCINRHMMYECHPAICPNGDECLNQRFQRRQYAPAKTFRTEKRGWGLVACGDIQKGQFVCEYVGDLIDEAECKRRLEAARLKNVTNFYMLTLDKNRIIDAGPKGNLSRFMNHSCQPNCETQKWNVNGDVRVGLFAIADIPCGTELTFNYLLDCYGNDKTVCRCGASVCSGFIGVRPKASSNIDSDQKTEKRRKKKKNKKAHAAIIDAQANSSKSLSKKAVRRSLNKNCSQLSCFACHEELVETDVISCSYRRICGKAYHLRCVQLEALPADQWKCIRHKCNLCTGHAVALCTLCITSYCRNHLVGNIIDPSADKSTDYSTADLNTFSVRRITCTAHHKGNLEVDVTKVRGIAASATECVQPVECSDATEEENMKKTVLSEVIGAIKSRKSIGHVFLNGGSVEQKLSRTVRRRSCAINYLTEENRTDMLVSTRKMKGLGSDGVELGQEIAVDKKLLDSPGDGGASKLRRCRKRSHLASLNDDLSVVNDSVLDCLVRTKTCP